MMNLLMNLLVPLHVYYPATPLSPSPHHYTSTPPSPANPHYTSTTPSTPLSPIIRQNQVIEHHVPVDIMATPEMEEEAMAFDLAEKSGNTVNTVVTELVIDEDGSAEIVAGVTEDGDGVPFTKVQKYSQVLS